MSLAVHHTALLALLPLALLPLAIGAQRPQPYPSFAGLAADPLSRVIETGVRLAGMAAIAALVLGLAGLHREGGHVERFGGGAHIVLLIDRSASMDDTFAGRRASGAEQSKSAAARRLLSAFVTSREHDRFGVAEFSTAPMHALTLTARKDAVLAAVQAIDRQGLAFTDVGRGLATALSIHNAAPSAAPRAVLLVSDGAAVIGRKVQAKLRAALAQRPVNLYWLFLRTSGSRGIFYSPASTERDTPQVFPERHLHKYFKTLGVPYRAFQAESPAAVGEAIAEIDKLERRPIRYTEATPQRDLAGWAYGIAALALALLMAAKLAEAPALLGARSAGWPARAPRQKGSA